MSKDETRNEKKTTKVKQN